MTTQQLASFGEASARDKRSARDAAFGLQVGKVPKRAAASGARPTMAGPRSPVQEPSQLRKAWHRLRKATGQAMGAVVFACVASATAALLTGVAFVGHAGTTDLKIATHRASLHAGDQTAHMAVDPLIIAQLSAQTALHITVSQPAGASAGSFVRVRGLPPATSLSKGHAMGPGTWAVPLSHLSGLKMKVAASAAGKAKVTFTLVAAHGEQLAEAKTTLVYRAAPRASPAAIAALAKLEADPARLPLLNARGDHAPAASSIARDATPGLVPGRTGANRPGANNGCTTSPSAITRPPRRRARRKPRKPSSREPSSRTSSSFGFPLPDRPAGQAPRQARAPAAAACLGTSAERESRPPRADRGARPLGQPDIDPVVAKPALAAHAA